MKIPFLLSFFCASLGAQGALLMLDFGPTTVTGANRTNSPYHSQNPTFTDLSWNKIETADVTSGIVLSDGTSTSISINLGYGNQTTLVDLSQQPSNTPLPK